ncbi:DEAD/DEAH box helicase [Paenibacillus flagellatus]|uniref:Helicase SNF n=1 Tax=Paenibacillus flagellatus TaxID=2211139 RepID=A0A2V5K8A2_9BACL|nr:DEAD/DEAH box helicase [Paenibacillus flagellatus]PYI55701.1 helicase SNF [Paenibacillus flagellatus]
MSFRLTPRLIKLLYSPVSYANGDHLYRNGRVDIERFDPEAPSCRGTVDGYKAQVRFDRNGDLYAACDCPAYDASASRCGHTAALLLYMLDETNGSGHGTPSRARSFVSMLQTESGPTEEQARLPPRFDGSRTKPDSERAADDRLAGELLGLFANGAARPGGHRRHFETRTPLAVEFLCKVIPYGYRNDMFGVEMKIGPQRLYIVPNIRHFLDAVDRGGSFAFSKHFVYDPSLHYLTPDHEAVVRELIRIYRNERMYRHTWSLHVHSDKLAGDRTLPVPPAGWEALLETLVSTEAAHLEHGGRTYDAIRLADGPLPIRFEFDRDGDDAYRFAADGLDDMTVMDAYGIAIAEGVLHKLTDDACSRLREMQRLLNAPDGRPIRLTPSQMELLMEKAVPGLSKLGGVRIAQAVSDRIVQTPLKAKLFLDRVKDRLLAGLEFHYGGTVVNPLEERPNRDGGDRILMRDGERERTILELIEQSAFVRTEGGYFLDGEEAEYEFLYRVLPQLEKLVTVYASSAVKIRLHAWNAAPKVRVDVDERTDWLEVRFDLDAIPVSELRGVLQALEEKRRYYRLPNGSLMPLESEEFQDICRFAGGSDFLRRGHWAGSTFRLPFADGIVRLMDADGAGTSVKLSKSLRSLLDNVRNPDSLDFPVPDSLAPVLRDYQKYGYQWMKTLAHYRFGGILADDMGLGKTVQSIAFLVSALPDIRGAGQPALIVCPASLVYNWRNELNRFAPELRAVIADGGKALRGRTLADVSRADVVITSYPLLRRDIESYAGLSFHTLILDEAQMFKNYATQTAQAVKSLRARHRFALTGTPVENTLEELWSIFEAVFPELFPGRRAFNDMPREAVAKRARPFLLRRLKTDVLKELPEKIESLQASELLPEQKKLYAAYLVKLRKETLKHLNEESFHKNRIKILAGLTRLRQLCCHPSLFVEGYAGSSAKFELLMEIVEEGRIAGRRMLVFSQFTEMLGLIGRELGVRNVPYFYLDGATPSAERVELAARFNEGERDVFLVSLKAGGTGLNLAGADTVILYDLWWNPAVEQQAADRAHRIGQKNVVQVIRLVAQGTVEEKMVELQQKKKNLIDEVVKPGEEALFSLTAEDVRELLSIR